MKKTTKQLSKEAKRKKKKHSLEDMIREYFIEPILNAVFTVIWLFTLIASLVGLAILCLKFTIAELPQVFGFWDLALAVISLWGLGMAMKIFR